MLSTGISTLHNPASIHEGPRPDPPSARNNPLPVEQKNPHTSKRTSQIFTTQTPSDQLRILLWPRPHPLPASLETGRSPRRVCNNVRPGPVVYAEAAQRALHARTLTEAPAGTLRCDNARSRWPSTDRPRASDNRALAASEPPGRWVKDKQYIYIRRCAPARTLARVCMQKAARTRLPAVYQSSDRRSNKRGCNGSAWQRMAWGPAPATGTAITLLPPRARPPTYLARPISVAAQCTAATEPSPHHARTQEHGRQQPPKPAVRIVAAASMGALATRE
jgi:hypothetical protein